MNDFISVTLYPSSWRCLPLLILLRIFRNSIINVLVSHACDEKMIFCSFFITFSILHCSCSHEHLMHSSLFLTDLSSFSKNILLESVLSSKKDLKIIAAKGKGKQKNVIDKYSSEKFLEAKLGVKVICDVRGKTSFLNYEFGIGCFNFIGLLEDNYAQDLRLGFFFTCLVAFCSTLVFWSSGQVLKEGQQGIDFCIWTQE